jgi:hypothetical protein
LGKSLDFFELSVGNFCIATEKGEFDILITDDGMFWLGFTH